MTTPHTLARLDTLIWGLIYGGLFLLILGIASHDETLVGGWSLSVIGAVLTLAGAALIVVRSRMKETPAGGAQSIQDTKGKR
jgi:hypothetical protein